MFAPSRRSQFVSVSDRGRQALNGVRMIARPVVRSVGRPIAGALAGRAPKTISAMFRVKNEEEYLGAALESIIDLVEEVIIVDNLSTDSTAAIIADFRHRHPAKVRDFSYPHPLARYGDENTDLASTRAGRRSPALLANYYNWCLDKCTHPFILKWDGDTVATAALAPTLENFRTSRSQILWYTGINLHESRDHLIAGRAYEDIEPRLFLRRFAHYGNSLGYVETLWSPYVNLFGEFSERVAEPLYFHLKFCKRQRFTNISSDLRVSEEQNSAKGVPLDAQLRDQVVALGL